MKASSNATDTGESQGAGIGGGAGSGQGTGNGEGLGSGIGDGSGGGTGGGPFRPGSGIEPPRLLREVKADYTDEAAAATSPATWCWKSSSGAMERWATCTCCRDWAPAWINAPSRQSASGGSIRRDDGRGGRRHRRSRRRVQFAIRGDVSLVVTVSAVALASPPRVAWRTLTVTDDVRPHAWRHWRRPSTGASDETPSPFACAPRSGLQAGRSSRRRRSRWRSGDCRYRRGGDRDDSRPRSAHRPRSAESTRRSSSCRCVTRATAQPDGVWPCPESVAARRPRQSRPSCSRSTGTARSSRAAARRSTSPRSSR